MASILRERVHEGRVGERVYRRRGRAVKDHESDAVCKICGFSYGEHRWVDDSCPITAEQSYPAKFVDGSFFMPVGKDEGGKE
jgi:hypothetical protein